MAGRYRYRCGDCPYRTPWSTESQSAQRQRTHRFRHHAGEPGGRVEFRERGREGAGCILLMAVLFLLLPALSMCQVAPAETVRQTCECAR